MPTRVPIDYRKFYKESPGALFECAFTDEWNILKASNSFYSQLGYDKDSFISLFGDSFLALMPPKTKRQFLSEFEKYIISHESRLSTDPLFMRVYLRRHDRLFQPVQIFVRLIDDGHRHLSCVYMPCLDDMEPLALSKIDEEAAASDKIREKLRRSAVDRDIHAESLRGKTILLAEDHPLNIRMITKILQRYGINVEVANNGMRAAEMFGSAEEDHFFAVLMDVIMPLLNGDDAAKRIRGIEHARGSERSVPIFAMYSNTDSDYKNGDHPDCFTGSLSKPVTMSRLMDVLINC